MAFPVGDLALGACRVAMGSDMGAFLEAGFNIDTTTKVIKSGYPSGPACILIDTVSATAYASLIELGGGAFSKVSEILSSLAGGIPPAGELTLEIFKPRGNNVIVDFSGVMLQQFELNFGGDFNSVKFFFEALGDETTGQLTGVTFGEGSAAFTAPPWLQDCQNLSVAMPTVTTSSFSGEVQAASIKLNGNYKRIMKGYPKLNVAMMLVDYSLDIEFTTEAFSITGLTNMLSPGAEDNISFSIPLVGGTTSSFNIPIAKFIGGTPVIKQDDWSGLTFRYTALMDGAGNVANIS